MATAKKNIERIAIKPPDLRVAEITLRGTSQLVINAMSQKIIDELRKKHEDGSTARNKRTREKKNFEALYEGAKHISTEGWCGIPASAFRAALIDTGRLAGFVMSKAKLSLFIIGDGVDRVTGEALVQIRGGDPDMLVMPARNATGVVDLRSRPRWKEWSVDLRVRYDADQFKLDDVINLLSRAGQQVGIGEGRFSSKNSYGMGWGCFEVVTETATEAGEAAE